MDERKVKLFEKYSPQDPALQELWNDHILFGKQVDSLESKQFLNPAETQNLKLLKKQKLDKKTKLFSMLAQYEAQEN